MKKKRKPRNAPAKKAGSTLPVSAKSPASKVPGRAAANARTPTPKPTPLSISAALSKRLQRELLAACEEVAASHGLAVEGGELQDFDPLFGFEIGFRVGIPQEDGELYSLDKSLFEVLAAQFGLKPTDFGRSFEAGGEAFRIVGLNPNRPKYPISAERISDGRGYKFSVENMRHYLSEG